LAGSCRAVLLRPAVYACTSAARSVQPPRSSISPALKIGLSHPQLRCRATLAAGYARFLTTADRLLYDMWNVNQDVEYHAELQGGDAMGDRGTRTTARPPVPLSGRADE
jgi:hypothetical protein